MAYNPKDYYFHQAKKQNYAARSVFKLEEIDQRFRILRSGQKILDLGAAPGSWSQYAAERVGKTGRVLGIDLQQIRLTLPNAVFITADMRQANLPEIMAANGIAPPFDAVLSDMAPKTTGIRVTDQVRSTELCELALATAEKYLRPGGAFVCKMFHSEDFESFRDKLRARFARVEILRPKSTRQGSKEVFFIALQFKPAVAKAADEMG
jgi:23S rRNA (uridine2552-2'-O)-methyltransferase